MKFALLVVRGLHGSRAEGTTRRFKVGDFKTEFNGLGVLRTDIRTVPGRRRGDRIGERMSASGIYGRGDDLIDLARSNLCCVADRSWPPLPPLPAPTL